jgi:hypothetical protein
MRHAVPADRAHAQAGVEPAALHPPGRGLRQGGAGREAAVVEDLLQRLVMYRVFLVRWVFHSDSQHLSYMLT